MDVTHFIMKDPEYRSNPELEAPEKGYKDLGEYDRLVHLHDRGHPDIHPLFREMRRLLDGYEPERFSIGEIHLTDWQEWAAYYGENDELHMPYNFAMVAGPWTAEWARDIVESQEAAIPEGAWPNYVVGNHDEARIASRLGAARARLATLLILTLRGTPTIYYGDELGMMQADIPPDQQQDPWGRRQPAHGRDGCRTPMQWEAGPGAGFTTGEPWLQPVDPDGSLNVDTQLDDERSALTFNRNLLAIRRHSEALTVGSHETIEGMPEGVFAFRRAAGDETLEMVLNFAEEPVSVQTVGSLVFASDPGQADPDEGRLQLGPLSGVILQR